MNWFLFLPPGLSIYLIAISGFSQKYLRKRVDSFVSGKSGLEDKKEVIKNVALDWAARLGFFNSMFAAMVSVFSIYSSTQNYNWTVGTFIVLLVIFILMFWWIIGHEPDELVSIRFRKLRMTHASMCRYILLLVNLVLIVAIAVSQRLIQQSQSH